jgi:hypothetical protein
MVKHLLFSLSLVSSISLAESIDNWKITIADEYKNYSTTYIDGSEFGITCKSICFYYLIQKQNCIKDGEDLTLLSNSIGDTLLVNNKCVEQNNVSFYIYDDLPGTDFRGYELPVKNVISLRDFNLDLLCN